mmetsp:Transcript_6516/g.13062  ORF Transcript_6516/g.13062 Transcript_6516/m.13062 type:complete len:167 (+) Transcript_6516:28-528(+)|eukprot:CAMPEP_0119069836 /NCGR_PEP_ID=MMETSP1178-20130426/29909_1 /TAXON_ID=33656 /ORGANISM="unid sp, Strain CCMP2000" /LENGTH=166 /DNA_ID=CAMNT_0007051635 /DNA_START=28 /DNA_END=528 /DNA_ORIENTATION=+
MGGCGGGPRHGLPPSSAAVQRMGLEEVVAALQAHWAVARVAEEACRQISSFVLSQDSNRQQAVDSGALEAVVAAMKAHLQVEMVQMRGCEALYGMCHGSGYQVALRRQRAAEAGASEAIAAAVQAHPDEVTVRAVGRGLVLSRSPPVYAPDCDYCGPPPECDTDYD